MLQDRQVLQIKEALVNNIHNCIDNDNKWCAIKLHFYSWSGY